MRLIDTHTHLDFPEFDADRAALLARSRALGVERLVLLGVYQANWQRLSGYVSAYAPAADRMDSASLPTRFVGVGPSGLANLRLIAANWLSSNLLAFVGLVLVFAVLLADFSFCAAEFVKREISEFFFHSSLFLSCFVIVHYA